MAGTILLITNFYPEFLDEYYKKHPDLATLEYQQQRDRLLRTDFALGDAYSFNLQKLGWNAEDIICNADRLQERWANEHDVQLGGNIHEQRRRIVAAQIDHAKPDAVLVFEWSPLGDDFLRDIKPRVPLLVGQVASTLPAGRTYDAYDLMVSAWPPIVEHFRNIARAAEHFRLGFDERVLARQFDQSRPGIDVSFVGGFAPAHMDRIPWLEYLLESVPVTIFGYGIDRVPKSSAIHQAFQGQAWGRHMYEILRASKITLHLNARIEVAGVERDDFAAAMRLYEATGIGTCLVTEQKSNLADQFQPGYEVATYRSAEECVRLLHELLADDPKRMAIAAAGQRRTLAEHAYSVRMAELSEIITSQLAHLC